MKIKEICERCKHTKEDHKTKIEIAKIADRHLDGHKTKPSIVYKCSVCDCVCHEQDFK